MSRSTEHQGDDCPQSPALLQTCVRMGPTRDNKKHQPLSGKRNVRLEESHRWAPSLRLTAESLRPRRRGPPGYPWWSGSQALRTQPAPGTASACSRAAGPQGCAGPAASQRPHGDPELGPWTLQLRPPPPRVKSTKATDPLPFPSPGGGLHEGENNNLISQELPRLLSEAFILRQTNPAPRNPVVVPAGAPSPPGECSQL